MSDDIEREELRRAARTLMTRPLLRSSGPSAGVVASIRKPRHQLLLQQWFDRNLGWNLIVDRDVVRLQKIPDLPAAHPGDAPPQRVCVLYCLVLAALEDCAEQTVISEVAQRVTDLSLTRSELRTYDPEMFSERRSLVQTLRLLTEHGVLTPTRGGSATEQDEAEYVTGRGDAIYDVHHRVAVLLLATPVPPSRAMHPGNLTTEPIADTADGRNRDRRRRLMRRLVDEPALYFDDLDEETQAYFKNQRSFLVGELSGLLDVRVEVRAEGAAIIDDELTDLRFPLDRTPQYAALLLAEGLAREAGEVDRIVPMAVLSALAEQVGARVAAKVKTIDGDEATPENILESALKGLQALRLIERIAEGVRVMPALARFRAPGIVGEHGTTAAEPLFDAEKP